MPILAALPRVSAAIAVAPLFPANVFPTLIRGGMAISLSLHLYPAMAADLPRELPLLSWIALAGKEVFIGTLLGLAVGTLVWALECVGALIDFQVGFSNAQVFDPFGGHDAGPLGLFMMRFGTLLFVAGGGLQVLDSLLFESFHIWPAASFYPSIVHLADFAGGSTQSLAELIVRLAAPVVLLLALIDFGFALVSRAVPQLNGFLTMPIKGALAALMIALYASYLGGVAAEKLGELQGWLTRSQPVLSGR
jgi:type III secretion protein T